MKDALQKAHLLVIDDESHIRELLSEFFQKRGYRVSSVGSAREAISILEEVRFDLVIVDILLPDGDGLELLESTKKKHAELPVIVMTGIGYDEELLQEAMRKGASGYVSKTLPLDQLLMEVHRTLNHSKP